MFGAIVNSRRRERKLLLYSGVYQFVGILILYLGGFFDKLPSHMWGVVITLGTILAFMLVSVFWQYNGFKADLFLLPITSVLTGTGLVFLLRLEPHYAVRQFFWLLVALAALVVVTTLLRSCQVLSEYQYIYALLGAVLLLLPIFLGVEQGGSRSWLDFQLFQVQTSEFVKILLVLFLAAFLAENRRILSAGSGTLLGVPIPGVRDWGPMVAMWTVALILLVFQRDLGAALIYFCTFLAMVYAATARVFYIIFGLVTFLLGGLSSYFIFHHVRQRVDIWLNPWPYFETSGYQVIQSLFAIGSGGILGTGLGAGKPDLIPAVHTDFIFAAICEEMGLLGGLGIIILFLLFIYRGFKIALQARDDFSALMAAGLTSLTGLQVFIIVAGVIKLLPLTGITMPYISYGGSSLVVNFILLGLLLNVSHRAGLNNEK
ncbi:cell division protein FtsW [Desulfohalotomaculum tongense]|uniref:FtsW/RodA/SpoVE family cell cycle protein n=1 Tax=Desulforadius tongensis TaxID=1216062 RepID=UPI00195AB9DB|nr:FtsW/RodA/SpoVE family cell cycle protein [Desulforadius tongensis]MBM7855747.1 cell division protein FtsW [Desulforadius tongensis]